MPPKKVLVPKERVFLNRRQGCFSCRHWDIDAGKKLWSIRRQSELGKGAAVALQSPAGENDPRVVACRRAVDTMDHSLVLQETGLCTGKGLDANDNPVEFVTKTYLCGKWTAKTGDGNRFLKADPMALDLLAKLDKN